MNILDFSNKYFADYFQNPEDILLLLKDIEIIKSNSKESPTAYGSSYINPDDRSVTDTKGLREIVADELDNYYTIREACDEVQVNESTLYKKLEELEFYDGTDFTQKAYDKYIVTSYGMITEEGIETLLNVNFTKSINRVCLVQWVGPFNNLEELNSWFSDNLMNEREYSFYYVKGIPKGSGNRKVYYYIGKTERELISNRLSQPGHKYQELRNTEIWIGRLSDYKQRSNLKLMEKKNTKAGRISHDLIESAESGLIYSFVQNNGDEYLLNDRKKNPPKYPVCVVNQWYKPVKNGFTLRLNKTETIKKIPDVICYNEEENLSFCQKLQNE